MCKTWFALESEYRERVDAGFQFLQDVYPKWLDKIDLSIFDVGDCGQCILGQIFGEFYQGCQAMGMNGDEVVELGFTASIHDADDIAIEAMKQTDIVDLLNDDFTCLTMLWRERIELFRQAGV